MLWKLPDDQLMVHIKMSGTGALCPLTAKLLRDLVTPPWVPRKWTVSALILPVPWLLHTHNHCAFFFEDDLTIHMENIKM
jgi:hypothetical protein